MSAFNLAGRRRRRVKVGHCGIIVGVLLKVCARAIAQQPPEASQLARIIGVWKSECLFSAIACISAAKKYVETF